jgi:hypothetical protein
VSENELFSKYRKDLNKKQLNLMLYEKRKIMERKKPCKLAG